MKNKRSHPDYELWRTMVRRTSDPKHHSFASYGGRGILLDPRWKSLENFLEDMGSRPSKDLSLDRINNDGPYTKENCRWATRKQQGANTRRAGACGRGHKWTPENTRWTNRGKARLCRICFLTTQKKHARLSAERTVELEALLEGAK